MNTKENTTQEEEVDLLAYVRILLRYWWFIGPAALFGGIAVYLICLALPPKYRAETRFEIRENKVTQLSGDITEEFRGRNFNPLSRHVVLLEGETLNKKIADKLLKKYPDLENYRLAPFTLTAVPVRGAEMTMLDVSIDSFSQEAAMEYLSILLDEYARIRLQESQQELVESRQSLHGEENRLEEELEVLQNEIDTFKSKNNFMFLETKTAYDRKFIAELLEKANHKQFQLDILKSYMSDLEKTDADKAAVFSQAIDAFLSLNQQSSSYSQARSSLEIDIIEWKKRQIKLHTLEAQKKIKFKTYKNAHPKMREINDQIEVVQTEHEVFSANILNTLKGRLRTMEAERKSYLDKSQAIEDSLGNHSGLLSHYENLQQKRLNLTAMKSKVHMKVIALSTDANKEKFLLRTIREAQLYEDPVWPNKLKFTALGFILFLGGSCAMVLLFFLSKARKYNFSQISEQHGIKCVATIPRFPAKKLKKNPFFLNTVPKGSVLSEAYRGLRLNIEKQLQSGKTLVVTSFGPGEGKTTSSTNLALCWAWTGKKILLIDGDFRRATLRSVFKDAPKEGLIDYLKDEQQDSIDKFLVRDVCENLTYLPAGRSEEFVTELLEGSRMANVLQQLEQEFDMIIIDSAPATRVVDTLRLSEMSAGTLLVTRSGHTNPQDANETLKRLPEGKIIGFVVNDFRAAHAKFTKHSGSQINSYSYAYQNYKKQY
ncbi:MAG: polysaccharide biosynthesis tyrosine autokinase [Lentisphaeraceae bacterium]|nr:polysaccharide biosynthesis tyrosine autokinase [Lentisphaeraceae bacterium]